MLIENILEFLMLSSGAFALFIIYREARGIFRR